MFQSYQATPRKREYNKWVANETMEDFALRFTARRARRWSNLRVANTAIGSISFLALEAIGAAITLTYGYDIAIAAILFVGALLFLSGLPISYYAARYGVDIDLLTRGAGFGYIGSTITSLIYASFTFIFFALEAAILALALEFCFGIPVFAGYIISALIVIPLATNGISKISSFQAWTQPLWVVLHLAPFVLLAVVGYDIENWSTFEGVASTGGASRVLLFGAAAGVVFALIAQIGEQVDYLRFLPEPRTRGERRLWWLSLLSAGPGWAILGVAKMLAGSYLMTLALANGVARADATDPTWLYHVAFNQAVAIPGLALILAGAFVILSQLKINVTNAYAGSIAWSNFFSRLTHSHPGRVVWLVFNVAIALILMELGVFRGLESILGVYSHVAVAWIGSLLADLIVNKPLGLSPKGIEFRRAHLYDINPVGLGSMGAAVVLSIAAYLGLFGEVAEAFSTLVALASSFLLAPLIAFGTKGRYYIARMPEATPQATATCSICDYTFDAEDMTHCPFHGGHICSLCCTLESNCADYCKPHGRVGAMTLDALQGWLPGNVINALKTPLARFFVLTTVAAGSFAGVLMLIRAHAGSPDFDAILTAIFGSAVIVLGILVWMFILNAESQKSARSEAEFQSSRLLREIRAHERTDQALQEAKEKAEAANEAKTRYMTGLSHELRTPLNSIYGFAQMLEKDPKVPARQHKWIMTIRRSSEHLAGLIEGLLDISRIEAGRLDILRDRINFGVFLSQVTSIFEEEAREKGLNFTFETRGKLPDWIAFDEKRLRQILINLLSNAIRYTERGGVRLTLQYRNEVALIEVVDTGIGIAPEELPRIWLPFQREGRSSAPGTGLGLTITRLLVEILGGEISAESRPGVGSTFRVRLMLPSIPQDSLTQGEGGTAMSLRIKGIAGPRRTLMIVDDDANHLELARDFLKPVGFNVLGAGSVGQALEMLEDLTPDAFILDIDMPGWDGWDFARQLRESRFRSAPIIVVSGHAAQSRSQGPADALCDAFVAKPYNLDDLVTRIADLLKVDLVTRKAPATEASALPARPVEPLPAALVDELLALAEIGHVRRIAEIIERFERDDPSRPPPMQVGRIRTLLEVYDLAGITALLKDERRRAA
ncbi:MAG: ATP-binding protein [Pseudomonadota bacterium]|nr:ATP-binding protein [Pseudomonadota bacterium]